MKKHLTRSLIGAIALVSLLLFSFSNTPTLALPAASGLGPGEDLTYMMSMDFYWTSITDAFATDNDTREALSDLYYYEDAIFYMDEYGDILVQSIANDSSGHMIATAVGDGERYSGGDSYISVIYQDYLGLDSDINQTFSYQEPGYNETFTDEDRSFLYNDTHVPSYEFTLFMLLAMVFMEEDMEYNETQPSLKQNMPPPNPGNAGNFSFIDEYMENYFPIFNNVTTYGSESYFMNGQYFNVNTVYYQLTNSTTIYFVGDQYDMFPGPWGLNGTYWEYLVKFTVMITVTIVYDVDTGLLLYGDSNATMIMDVYASTVYTGFDPDGSGPLAPRNVLTEIYTNHTVTFYTYLGFNGISYLYTSGGTNTTQPTTSTNTNQTTTTSNTTTTNATQTPLLDLPASDFATITAGLVSTVSAIAIIRKRK